jgi:hypothetical protein
MLCWPPPFVLIIVLTSAHLPCTSALQAGLIMVGIANGLTIIFMGLYEHKPHYQVRRSKEPCVAAILC